MAAGAAALAHASSAVELDRQTCQGGAIVIINLQDYSPVLFPDGQEYGSLRTR